MMSWVVVLLFLIVVFLSLVVFLSRTQRRRGQLEERVEGAESRLHLVGTAMETLTATPPDRAALVSDWLQRIRKTRKPVDPSVSDSDNGSSE